MASKLCTVAILLALPVAAQAQTVTGGLTLSYGSLDGGDATADLAMRGLDGRLNIDFENGFSFGMQAGWATVDVEGAPFDLTGEFIGLDGRYRFSNGMTVGGFVEQLTFGIDPLPVDISLKSYGLTAGYDMNGLEIEAFAGRTSVSPSVPVDITNRGLSAKYTAVPKLTLGATYLKATLKNGGASEDIDFRGIAATYEITDALMAFGGASQSSIGLVGLDFDSIGFGLGYDLAQMTGFSSTLSLELARTTQSSGGFSADLDTVRVGVSFPLGQKGTALPMSSVADAILNPRRGAFNTALTAAF